MPPKNAPDSVETETPPAEAAPAPEAEVAAAEGETAEAGAAEADAAAEVLPAEEPAEAVAATVEDLEDVDHSNDPGVVSAAPPRPHAVIVGQLQIRFEELLNFVHGVEGEIEGELGELLTFVRAKLAARKA